MNCWIVLGIIKLFAIVSTKASVEQNKINFKNRMECESILRRIWWVLRQREGTISRQTSQNLKGQCFLIHCLVVTKNFICEHSFIYFVSDVLNTNWLCTSSEAEIWRTIRLNVSIVLLIKKYRQKISYRLKRSALCKNFSFSSYWISPEWGFERERHQKNRYCSWSHVLDLRFFKKLFRIQFQRKLITFT